MSLDLPAKAVRPMLRTLPGDDVRQILWRFHDRPDLQMLVQAARSVARVTVARLVADGERNTHAWTARKAAILTALDAAGVTAAFMEPDEGGYLEGPKNMALALAAFELAWVDAGAATMGLAGNLGLAPIRERGTPAQKREYMRAACPPGPGEDRSIRRAAFCLTEPIPFVGVDTGVLSGKVRIAEWEAGREPILEIDKRGRFITNMECADVVTAAVAPDDPRIKTSCFVILESTDQGVFDRGTRTRKMVHQLSSTCDPVFRLKVPASRIVGGYTIEDGLVVPNVSHSEVLEAVFSHTRVTVGLMTAAKLLSAVEPLIRYHRGRFRGGETARPGSPRYDQGLQQKEDVLHRVVDVWATGEAAASLGFEATRLFDELDALAPARNRLLAERGVTGTGRAAVRALGQAQRDALELVRLEARPRGRRGARYEALRSDVLVRHMLLEALGNVLCPATKLWNTGNGANVMREAVSLMGGYGITEDCPGFLGHKWMDAQLEATYEGPEAVQRRQLSVTMTHPLFLAQLQRMIGDLRRIAGDRPETGACTVATAMQMWLWTLGRLQGATDAEGEKLYRTARHGVTFPLADALGWLLSARALVLDVVELQDKGPENPVLADGLPGLAVFYADLAHVQAARAAGEVGRICADLVYGYNAHPAWDEEACARCFSADDLDALEGTMPGIAAAARTSPDVVEPGERHPAKAGPCAGSEGLQGFAALRLRLDGCLTGARLAKDRAAESLTKVMIPEALEYPV